MTPLIMKQVLCKWDNRGQMHKINTTNSHEHVELVISCRDLDESKQCKENLVNKHSVQLTKVITRIFKFQSGFFEIMGKGFCRRIMAPSTT